jgi:hypothetical protein
MSGANDIPNDLRPLDLARGYLISADGRVFNERTRRESKSFTLHQARITAGRDIAFDPGRRDGEADELVCVDVVAYRFRPGSPERIPEVARVARWVIIERPPDICFDIGPDGSHAMRRTHPDGRIEWLDDSFVLPGRMSGGSDPAHGDTAHGWCYLATDATDPQCRTSVLMHGPSVAHKLFTRE